MQQELEDYHDLLELRRAKADPRNQEGRAFNIVASELGLTIPIRVWSTHYTTAAETPSVISLAK